MTRYNTRHYEDAAKILRIAKVTIVDTGMLGKGIQMGIRWVKEDLASLFAEDNPNGCGPDVHDGRCFNAFDREQFFKDCEIK